MPQDQNPSAGFVPLKDATDPSAGFVPLSDAPAEQPSALSRFISGLGRTLLPSTTPSDYVQGPVFAIQHPVTSAELLGRAIVDAQSGQLSDAAQSFREGHYVEAAGHGLAGAIPLVGPAAAAAGEAIGSGDIAGGAGMATGLLLPTVAAKAVPKPAAGALRVASETLESSADKSLEQVLGATTQKLKAAATEDVVPGMQERGVIARSRKALLEKANANVKKFGQEVLEEAQKADATGRRINTSKLVNRLEDLKEDYQTRDETGAVMAAEPKAIETIDGIQDVLRERGNSILPSTLINFRRFLDEQVARSQAGFLLDDKVAVDSARKWASNDIRDEINTDFPNVAKVNKEFSFWKDLQTVLGATMQRTASQAGVVPALTRAVRGGGLGGVVGGAVGGGWGAAAGALIGDSLAELMQTTGWRTVSASTKTTIANLLARGDVTRANAIADALLKASPARLVGAGESQTDEEK
jgi:hypothetical protein